MEFWGVEVKSGESLKVDPGDDKIVHLSMACLGEVSKDKGTEPVFLYVKSDNQKLAIGTLSSEKFPQISYDLIFEKEFELSHNWKNGSVFFTGYKAESQLASDDDDEDSDDFIGEDIPVIPANGKPESEVKIANPKKNEKDNKKDTKGKDNSENSSEADSDEESSEDEPMVNGQIENSEDDDDSDGDDEDDDEDDSDDEETPKKIEGSNKRLPESSKKTPVPVKKAKFVTPEKTGGKTSCHVATPYPKQAGKAAANDKQQVKQQTPKSGGDYSCKPCNRSFKTEDALGSHNKAKHSAK